MAPQVYEYTDCGAHSGCARNTRKCCAHNSECRSSQPKLHPLNDETSDLRATATNLVLKEQAKMAREQAKYVRLMERGAVRGRKEEKRYFAAAIFARPLIA